jgi:hypothetical protein
MSPRTLEHKFGVPTVVAEIEPYTEQLTTSPDDDSETPAGDIAEIRRITPEEHELVLSAHVPLDNMTARGIHQAAQILMHAA